jgi:hypothetical protein
MTTRLMTDGFAYQSPLECPKIHSENLESVEGCVTPLEIYRSAGILTCCPSTTPFGLTLGPTNPGTIRVALETLSLRWTGFSPVFLLLMPTFSLLYAPRWLTPSASVLNRMLLYQSKCPKTSVRDFGIMLSPDKFSAPDSLTSELLRFL